VALAALLFFAVAFAAEVFAAEVFAALLEAVVLGVDVLLDVRERAGVCSEPGCSGFMSAKME
jgi:hypothetical protein